MAGIDTHRKGFARERFEIADVRTQTVLQLALCVVVIQLLITSGLDVDIATQSLIGISPAVLGVAPGDGKGFRRSIGAVILLRFAVGKSYVGIAGIFVAFNIIRCCRQPPASPRIDVTGQLQVKMFSQRRVITHIAQAKTPLRTKFVVPGEDQTGLLRFFDRKKAERQPEYGHPFYLQGGRTHDYLLVGNQFLFLGPDTKMGLWRITTGDNCILIVDDLIIGGVAGYGSGSINDFGSIAFEVHVVVYRADRIDDPFLGLEIKPDGIGVKSFASLFKMRFADNRPRGIHLSHSPGDISGHIKNDQACGQRHILKFHLRIAKQIGQFILIIDLGRIGGFVDDLVFYGIL